MHSEAKALFPNTMVQHFRVLESSQITWSSWVTDRYAVKLLLSHEKVLEIALACTAGSEPTALVCCKSWVKLKNNLLSIRMPETNEDAACLGCKVIVSLKTAKCLTLTTNTVKNHGMISSGHKWVVKWKQGRNIMSYWILNTNKEVWHIFQLLTLNKPFCFSADK